MKQSKHQPIQSVSNLSVTELLVILSLFIALCGIQLTAKLATFDVVHFFVAALFSAPLYGLRRCVYKRRPQPPSRFVLLLLALAITTLTLLQAHSPLESVNTLCFALLMVATIAPPHSSHLN